MRRARLEEQRRVAVEEAQAERELTLVIGRLEEFATRVSDGLDELDFAGKQALIRTLVRRIEIDRNHVEVVFRVPPPTPEGSSPSEPHPHSETWHHCTGDHDPAAWMHRKADLIRRLPDNLDADRGAPLQ